MLLDTCAFLWIDSNERSRIGRAALTLLASEKRPPLLSIASVWEMAIKSQAGKLPLSAPLESLVASAVRDGVFEVAGVEVQDVIATTKLPLHHRDPFDRLIAAQCLQGDFTLLSSDSIFDAYGVKRVWS